MKIKIGKTYQISHYWSAHIRNTVKVIEVAHDEVTMVRINTGRKVTMRKYQASQYTWQEVAA